jgi:hypothetical protein
MKETSDEHKDAVKGVARAFAKWAVENESLDARHVLAGLGYLGNFLKAVSEVDIDVERGQSETGNFGRKPRVI